MATKHRFLITYILLGAANICGQTAVVRELLGTLGGNELLIGLALASWLTGMAIGAKTATRIKKYNPFIILVFIYGLLIPLTVICLRYTPAYLLEFSGELASPADLAKVLLLLLPVATVGGSLFPLGLWAAKDKLTLPARYGAEGAGALAGGLLTLVLLRFIPNPGLAGIAGAMAICSTFSISSSKKAATLILTLTILLGTVPLVQRLDQFYFSQIWTKAVWQGEHESPYGRLGLFQRQEQFDFFLDGSLLLSTGSLAASEELAHLPLALLPSPNKVLLIGNILSPLPQEILRHPIETLYLVDIAPELPAWGLERLAEQRQTTLIDPRHDLRTVWLAAPPRRFLQNSRDLFDLIIIALPDPNTAALNRFYTTEFFQTVKRHLNRNGLLIFNLSGSENYMNQPLRQLINAERKAVTEAGMNATVIAASQTLIIASEQELHLDATQILGTLRERNVETLWLEGDLPFLLHPLHQQHLTDQLDQEQGSIGNYDFSPFSLYLTIQRWLSYFYPAREGAHGLAAFLLKAKAFLPGLAFFLLFIPFTRGQGTTLAQRLIPVSVTVSGFAALGGQLIIMFSYQAAHGALYRELGMLTALFMAGSVSAAAVAHYFPKTRKLIPLIIIDALLFAIAGATLTQSFQPIGIYYLAALLNGFISSSIYLSAATGHPQGATSLYAFDLTGALLAAITVAPFMLPLYSFSFTAMIIFGLLSGILFAKFRLEYLQRHGQTGKD